MVLVVRSVFSGCLILVFRPRFGRTLCHTNHRSKSSPLDESLLSPLFGSCECRTREDVVGGMDPRDVVGPSLLRSSVSSRVEVH